MKIPQYIFLHHSAVSREKNPDQWQATDAYHKSKGWGGGGYNYEVSAAGSVHQFREDGAITAAQYQKGMNDGRAISICLDGNFDIETPTEAQKAVVRGLLKEKMTKWKIPKENVFCHRAVANKSCPGKLLPDDIYTYFLKPLPLPDEGPSEWAKDAWEFVVNELEVVSKPKEPATKEFIATLLYRYHRKFNLVPPPSI